MEKYFEINKNNQNIRCKLYYDKKHTIEKVVLFGHGFAGHKDNSAAQKFADRVLTKYKGIAVLIYNLPCHGDDVKKAKCTPVKEIDSSLKMLTDAMFNKMVSNTIKENGYSSSYGPDNFTLIDGGNGQYSLAEKSTGTIVGHYSVKNGDLYKQDVITGNDVKVK